MSASWARAVPLLLLLPLLGAHAAPAQRVLLDVKGPGAAALRAGLKRAMAPEASAVRSAGLNTQPPAASVRAAARKQRGAAVVVARTERSGARTVVSVRLFHGRTGAPLEFLRWSVPSARQLGRVPEVEAAQLQEALAGLTGRARPAVAQAPAPEPAPQPAPASAPVPAAVASRPPAPEQPRAQVAPAARSASAPRQPATKGVAPRDEASGAVAAEPSDDSGLHAEGTAPIAARVNVGGRVVSRRLQYTDDVRNALPRYRLPAGPALTVDVDWYPGTHLTRGFWSHVGVTASAEILMGVRSVMPDGSTHHTDSDAYRGGFSLRLPLGRGQLGADATYGSHVFGFRQDARAVESLVPQVRYHSVRAGLSGQVPLLRRLTLVLEAGAHKVWERGELSERFFPRRAVGAVDGTLAAEYHLGEAWRLRFAADYRRYYYAMHPEPGDRFIVGGALDEYLSGTVALGFELR